MADSVFVVCFWLVVLAAGVLLLFTLCAFAYAALQNARDARARRRNRGGWQAKPESSVPLPSVLPRRVPNEALRVMRQPATDDASPHDIDRVIAEATRIARDAASHH